MRLLQELFFFSQAGSNLKHKWQCFFGGVILFRINSLRLVLLKTETYSKNKFVGTPSPLNVTNDSGAGGGAGPGGGRASGV